MGVIGSSQTIAIYLATPLPTLPHKGGGKKKVAMRPEDILSPTPAGVCWKLGGFHIDPTRPVERR